MSIYEDSVTQLKQMYEIIKKNNLPAYNIGRDDYLAMNKDERSEMDRNFQFMKEEGWIRSYTPCVGIPVSFAITSQGIKVVEEIAENPSASSANTYNVFNPSNSIIGGSNNIINVGLSFDDLNTLIEQHFSSQNERNEILDALNSLQTKISSNQPLEKGVLAKINDKLESCSWLSSGIAAHVIHYLSKP